MFPQPMKIFISLIFNYVKLKNLPLTAMRTVTVNNKYIIALNYRDAGQKFRLSLSLLIKQKFGKRDYDEITLTKIISFCLGHYSAEFEKICQGETSYSFYKMAFWLNEQASEMRTDKKALDNLPTEFDLNYFAIYRRILKMILEQGCLVKMNTGEKWDGNFKARFQKIFDDLLFLGDAIIGCAENYAEQDMIGDAIGVSFDEQESFYFYRKHYFEDAFRHIINMKPYYTSNFVIDTTGEQDFIDAVKDSFELDFTNIIQMIGELFHHRDMKLGDVLAIGKNDLSIGMKKFFNTSMDKSNAFFSGLYFSQHHRHPVNELVTKPYSINRFLYRPILIWNIDQKDFCIMGLFSFREAITSLYLNAFPWAKAPEEWKRNKKFNQFINKKHNDHDKWLDDAVEKEIRSTNIIFQRDVKTIKAKKRSINIEIPACGQIDFLAININTKKLFIIEDKHLLGRYDMASQKIDFYNFTTGKGSYDSNIGRKIKWISDNIKLIEEHFQSFAGNSQLSITDFTIEGIFVINTPTFYMYTSDFRIYTYHELSKVLTGTYVDKTYTLVSIDDEYESTIWIRYPYFKRKQIYYYNDPDEDCEVDKYGFPIKV